MFDTHKTRMIVLRCGEEIVTMQYRNVTDRRTDRHNSYVNNARQHSCAIRREAARCLVLLSIFVSR